MEPVYRYMMPYPYQRDHTDYRPNCYPRFEAVPPQMYANPTRPPVNYEYWPWGSNYGYAHPPVACHGCCNHSHMPTHYAWRPPYSPVPSSHYPGSYPPFPSEYVPLPFYPMEQPQLAYNNNTSNRCCGCPNHLCSQKEQENIKIEEEEPEREGSKKAPVAPFKFTNSPYPLMWLPIDHGNEKAHQEDLKDGFTNAKPHEPKTDEKHTGGWHGWYPLELHKSGSPKEKEEKKISSHESDHSKRQFPFPVFWMPYMPEEKKQEEPKEINVKPQLLQESVKDSGEQTGGQVYPTTKDIPVKEARQHEESVSPGNKEDNRESSLKDGTDSGEKLAKSDPKRKASSPPKSSKLPPVCLRVDPLPRTKADNGKSRYPSPPSDRQKHDQLTDEVKNALSSSYNEKSDKTTGKEVKAAKGTTKTVEVVDGKTSGKDFHGNPTEEKHDEDNIASECTVPVAVTKCKSGDAGSGSEETGEIFRAEEVASDGSKEVHKPKLSEEDAAIIIQSAYRGFDIRRWELVKKLKQISNVREQIPRVKNLIQAMESSSDIQANSKQRHTVAETIMSLLLTLDTIQGLHPSIREVRKFVVRELVTLQEKLDALIGEQSKVSEGQESLPKCEEDALKATVHISSHNSTDLVEPCQNQLDGSSNDVSEIPEKFISVEELNGIPENKAVEILEKCTTEGSNAATGPIIKEDNEQGSQTDEESPSDKEDNENPVQATVFSLPQNSSTEGVSDSLANNEDKPASELIKQPIKFSGDCREGKDHNLYDADVDVPNQAMQLEQRLIEAYSSELNHDVNEGKHDHTESLDISNVPLGEIDINSYSTETIASDKLDNCKLDDESGTMKQVGNETAEDTLEHDKCSAQSPKSVISDIFGSSEVFGETVNPATKASNEIDANTKIPLQGSSFSEEAVDVFPKKEFNEEQVPIEEFVESADLIGESSLEQVFEEKLPQEQEHFSEDINSERQGLGGACVKVEIDHKAEDGPEITLKSAKDLSQGTYVGDETNEKDGQLIKENEMLRDMVEKLMKSGEEQLRVITNLCGRVKNLERNMSKKKKLKMKQNRGKRLGTVKEWSDGVVV